MRIGSWANLPNSWEKAPDHAGATSGFRGSLIIGGELSLVESGSPPSVLSCHAPRLTRVTRAHNRGSDLWDSVPFSASRKLNLAQLELSRGGHSVSQDDLACHGMRYRFTVK